MPSYPCRNPVCSAYVPRRGDFCPAHQEQGRRERAERHKFYDQHLRDPESKRFYNSTAWKHARAAKLAADPVCARCGRAWARHVHHVVPLKRCTPEQKLDPANLKGLCPTCHNEVEAETEAAEVGV